MRNDYLIRGNMHKFAGKRAIVLGGTSGIGLAATKQLRDAGAEVVAASRRGADGAAKETGVTWESCDVLDRDGLEQLFARYAPYDFLVCAATGGAQSQRAVSGYGPG